MKKRADKSKEKPEGVTYSVSFAGVIRKGPKGKSLIVKSPRWYHHQLQKYKDGEEVTLMIHNRKPKRSEQQNRYYWGAFLPKVAEETGENDLDKLHELFKGKFLTKGVVEVLGEKVRLKKSTTELGVGEFTQYIMDIETLTGVSAPPTANYGLKELDRAKIEEIEYPDEVLGPPAF